MRPLTTGRFIFHTENLHSTCKQSPYWPWPGLSESGLYPVCLSEWPCPLPGALCHGAALQFLGPVWLCSLSPGAVCFAQQPLCGDTNMGVRSANWTRWQEHTDTNVVAKCLKVRPNQNHVLHWQGNRWTCISWLSQYPPHVSGHQWWPEKRQTHS